MGKSTYNLESLSSVETIVGMAIVGESGRYWYHAAARKIAAVASELGCEPKRFADVLAITSPRVKVARNWNLTLKYIAHQSRDGMMKGVRAALDHYLATGEIRGPKTGPFARAVLGDEQAIVLDTWMAKAFKCPHEKLRTKAVHAECATRVRAAAGILGWTPAQVQAAVWTAAVRAANREPGTF